MQSLFIKRSGDDSVNFSCFYKFNCFSDELIGAFSAGGIDFSEFNVVRNIVKRYYFNLFRTRIGLCRVGDFMNFNVRADEFCCSFQLICIPEYDGNCFFIKFRIG